MEHRNSLRVGILSTYVTSSGRVSVLLEVAGCSWIFQFLRQHLPVRRGPEALENVDHIGIRADQDARSLRSTPSKIRAAAFSGGVRAKPLKPLNILFALGMRSTAPMRATGARSASGFLRDERRRRTHCRPRFHGAAPP